MSSHRMRMKVRLHRLQEVYKSLGKEPNAREYEIKGLITDFDRVARKQLARLKKGKFQRFGIRA